jgi:hypothetical protein
MDLIVEKSPIMELIVGMIPSPKLHPIEPKKRRIRFSATGSQILRFLYINIRVIRMADINTRALLL